MSVSARARICSGVESFHMIATARNAAHLEQRLEDESSVDVQRVRCAEEALRHRRSCELLHTSRVRRDLVDQSDHAYGGRVDPRPGLRRWDRFQELHNLRNVAEAVPRGERWREGWGGEENESERKRTNERTRETSVSECRRRYGGEARQRAGHRRDRGDACVLRERMPPISAVRREGQGGPGVLEA